ncbi:reverse transcriptase domain-containing protein [Tanacetum coccineum]|uniref:Reverse transcriptase domain-containing protein n=1 Tax=Tanacetum coccineum TaxID=301880 RepID=A0ABQ5HHE7_9ASTR
MMAIFHDMIEKTMEVFMDDFSVFGDSFSSCLANLDKMLKRCEDTKLALNWEKSHFMVKEGIILGHKISRKGIEVDKAKVDVISKLPHLTIKLTEALILIAPNWDQPFEIMCNASDYAIGAVLGRIIEKHFRPIHYASKTMTEAESNYTTTEKEMLTVVYVSFSDQAYEEFAITTRRRLRSYTDSQDKERIFKGGDHVRIYLKSQENSQKQANTGTRIRRVQKEAKESKPEAKPEKSSPQSNPVNNGQQKSTTTRQNLTTIQFQSLNNGESTKKRGFCTKSSHRTSTNVTSWIASLAIHVNPKDDQTTINHSQMIGKIEGGGRGQGDLKGKDQDFTLLSNKLGRLVAAIHWSFGFNAKVQFRRGGNFLDKIPQEGLAIIESKSKVRYSRSRASDSRVSTDAPLSNSSPSNNSFDIQQIAASLKDKMTIKMKQMMNEMKALVVTILHSVKALRKYESRVDRITF